MSRLPPELIESNRESWRWVLYVFGELLKHSGSTYLLPLRNLAQRIADDDRGRRYRGGMSLTDVLITTMDHHGPIEEPFIRLGLDQANEFHIQYWHSSEIREYVKCSEQDVDIELNRLLDRLWADTRGAPPA